MSVEFQECLKSLRLPGVKDCYQEVADQARAQRYTYEQYLAEVLDREREERRRHRIERSRGGLRPRSYPAGVGEQPESRRGFPGGLGPFPAFFPV